MLDEFRSTSITWDKATRRIYSPITANASDSNGRKLNTQVVNYGQVENLTGATLHLYWETKDKAQHGLDAFKASDISKGEFELFYTTGMLSNVGELNATLVLVDSTGKVVSDWFKITVTRGINEGAIESENSFSSLTQALIDISNLEQNYAPRLNDLTAQLQQTKNHILDYDNRAGRGYGVYFTAYTDGYRDVVIRQINDAIAAGCDSICFYIDIDVDHTTGVYDDLTTKIGYWNQVFSHFVNTPWKKCILRTANGPAATPTANFFTGVLAKDLALLNGLNYDFTTIVISNESPNDTNDTQWDASWQNVISGIKTSYPNIEVTMSPTESELMGMSDALLNSLDVLGVNYYPSISFNPNLEDVLQTDLDNVVLQGFETLYAMTRRFNKKLFIFEIGCHRGKYAYMSPGDWHMGTELSDANHLRWWQTVLPIIDDFKWLEGYAMFYAPLDQTNVRDFVTSYFREGVENGKY